MGTLTKRSETKRKQDIYNYYTFLKHHFEVSEVKSLDRASSTRAQKARAKLLKLSFPQFYELSTDVSDELKRRISESPSKPDYLLPRPNFHVKRNQARQKLANLSQLRFNELVDDILYEIERRGLHQEQQQQIHTDMNEEEEDEEEDEEELGEEDEENGDDTFKNPSNLNNFEDYQGFSAPNSPALQQGFNNIQSHNLDNEFSNDKHHTMTSSTDDNRDSNINININNNSNTLRPGSKVSSLQTPTTAALLQSSSVIPKKASIDWSSSSSENEEEVEEEEEGLTADNAPINETLLMNESSMAQSSVFPSMRKSLYGSPDTTQDDEHVVGISGDGGDGDGGGYIRTVTGKFLPESALAAEGEKSINMDTKMPEETDSVTGEFSDTRKISGDSDIDDERALSTASIEIGHTEQTLDDSLTPNKHNTNENENGNENESHDQSFAASPSRKNDYLQRELITLNAQLGDLSVENENLKQKVSELEMELKLKLRLKHEQGQQQQQQLDEESKDNSNGQELDKREAATRSIDLLRSAQIAKFVDPNGIVPLTLIVQLNQTITNFYKLIDSGTKDTTQLFQHMAKVAGLVSLLLTPADLPDYKDQVILLKTSLSYAITTVRYYAIYGALLPKIVIQAAIGEISFAICNLISATKLQVTEEQRQAYLNSLSKESDFTSETLGPTPILTGQNNLNGSSDFNFDPTHPITPMVLEHPRIGNGENRTVPNLASPVPGPHMTAAATSKTLTAADSTEDDYFLVNPRDLRRESIENSPVKPLKLTQKFGMGSGIDVGNVIPPSTSSFDSNPRKPSNAGLFNLFVESKRKNNSTSTLPPRKPKQFLNLASPVKPRFAPVSSFNKGASSEADSHPVHNANGGNTAAVSGVNVDATRSEPAISTPAMVITTKKDGEVSNGSSTVSPREHSNLQHQISFDSEMDVGPTNIRSSPKITSGTESPRSNSNGAQTVQQPTGPGTVITSQTRSLTSLPTSSSDTHPPETEDLAPGKPLSSLAAKLEEYNSSETLDQTLRIRETSLSHKINEFSSSSNDLSDSSSFVPELRARQMSLSEKIDKFSSSSNETNDLHELHAVESREEERGKQDQPEQRSLSPTVLSPDNALDPALTSQSTIIQGIQTTGPEVVAATGVESDAPSIEPPEKMPSTSQTTATVENSKLGAAIEKSSVRSASIPTSDFTTTTAGTSTSNKGTPSPRLPTTDTISLSKVSHDEVPAPSNPSELAENVNTPVPSPGSVTANGSIKSEDNMLTVNDTPTEEVTGAKRSGSTKSNVSAVVAAFGASIASVGGRLSAEIAKSLKRQPSGKAHSVDTGDTIEADTRKSIQEVHDSNQIETQKSETPATTPTPSLGFTVSRTISETSPISLAGMSPVRAMDIEQEPVSQETGPLEVSPEGAAEAPYVVDTKSPAGLTQQTRKGITEGSNNFLCTGPDEVNANVNPTTSADTGKLFEVGNSGNPLNHISSQSNATSSSVPALNQIYTSGKLSASIDEIFSRRNGTGTGSGSDDHRTKSNRSEGNNREISKAVYDEAESVGSDADSVYFREHTLKPAEDASSINLNESPRVSIISTEDDAYSTISRQVDGQVAPKVTYGSDIDSNDGDDFKEDGNGTSETHGIYNGTASVSTAPVESGRSSTEIKRENDSDDEMFSGGRAFRIVNRRSSTSPSSSPQPPSSSLSPVSAASGALEVGNVKPSEKHGFRPITIGKVQTATVRDGILPSTEPRTIETGPGIKVKIESNDGMVNEGNIQGVEGIKVKEESDEDTTFSPIEGSIVPVKAEDDSDSLLLDKPGPKLEDDDVSYQFIPLKKEDEDVDEEDDDTEEEEEEEEDNDDDDDDDESETEEEEEEEEEDFDIDAFDIENPDNTLGELLLYLEHQTIQVISTIQSLLSSIKRPESTKGELRYESNAINQVIGQIVDATSVSMNQSRNANLKEHGSWVVQSLEDCSRRMKTLCKLNKNGELEAEEDDNEYADKNFKQRLAGIAFDIAKCTKELVKTVEEASLKEEIEYLNMRIH